MYWPARSFLEDPLALCMRLARKFSILAACREEWSFNVGRSTKMLPSLFLNELTSWNAKKASSDSYLATTPPFAGRVNNIEKGLPVWVPRANRFNNFCSSLDKICLPGNQDNVFLSVNQRMNVCWRRVGNVGNGFSFAFWGSDAKYTVNVGFLFKF